MLSFHQARAEVFGFTRTLKGAMSDLDDGDFLDREAEEDSDEQSGEDSDDSSEEEEEEGETTLE